MRVLRLTLALSATAALVSAQPAAGSGRTINWVRYRSPDSTWVALFPARVSSRRDDSTPPVSHFTAVASTGTTNFFVDAQDSEDYRHEAPAETMRRFPLIGYTMFYADVTQAPAANVLMRTRLARRFAGDSTQGAFVLTRTVVANGRVFLLTAASGPEMRLAPEAKAFVGSFTLCDPQAPCEPTRTEVSLPADDECCFFLPGQQPPQSSQLRPGTGAGGGGAPGASYFPFQVETQVRLLQPSPVPQYPDSLKASGVTGEVRVQCVVDTLGRVELETVEILKSTHLGFSEAVRAVLPEMRFAPAEIRGQKVRQLVVLPFRFLPPR